MLIDEINPQLGANLDLNNFNIAGTGSVSVVGSGNFTQGLFVNNTGVSLGGHTHPQLETNLDLNTYNIVGTGVVDINGSGNFTQGLFVNNTGVSLGGHTHPQLETNLDLNTYNIVGTGVVDINGSGNFTQGLFVNNTGVSLGGHTHPTSSITDFNSSVSGLLSVVSVVGSENINVTSANKTFTISPTGLVKSDATAINGASIVNNIVVISEASYNTLSVKNPNTIYFVT